MAHHDLNPCAGCSAPLYPDDAAGVCDLCELEARTLAQWEREQARRAKAAAAPPADAGSCEHCPNGGGGCIACADRLQQYVDAAQPLDPADLDPDAGPPAIDTLEF